MVEHGVISTSLSVVVGSTAASVLAGGVGSAIGLCIAYPIDVLKTKAQVKVCTEGKANETLFARANSILRQEGIAGFYGGVITAMIGKAFTSSISFGANRLAIGLLNASNFLEGGVSARNDTPFVTLLLAACFAGFIQTFLNCPIGKFASEFFWDRITSSYLSRMMISISSLCNKRTGQSYDASSRKWIPVCQRAGMY